mmetsp:Transcript_35965/g.76736  ORF Transcript_35965/g.76736 Transcript_35965/m.76736 type:complete len:204 (-) Transcript_35965:357-968(-)
MSTSRRPLLVPPGAQVPAAALTAAAWTIQGAARKTATQLRRRSEGAAASVAVAAAAHPEPAVAALAPVAARGPAGPGPAQELALELGPVPGPTCHRPIARPLLIARPPVLAPHASSVHQAPPCEMQALEQRLATAAPHLPRLPPCRVSESAWRLWRGRCTRCCRRAVKSSDKILRSSSWISRRSSQRLWRNVPRRLMASWRGG